jgi:hypothetical protein
MLTTLLLLVAFDYPPVIEDGSQLPSRLTGDYQQWQGAPSLNPDPEMRPLASPIQRFNRSGQDDPFALPQRNTFDPPARLERRK